MDQRSIEQHNAQLGAMQKVVAVAKEDMRSFRRESSDITHRVEQSLKLAAIGAAYDEGKSSSNEKERSEVTCCPGIWSKNAKKPQVKK